LVDCKICGAEIPDVDRVTVCMIRNKAQLSPGCRVFFRPGPEPSETTGARAGGPMRIKPVFGAQECRHQVAQAQKAGEAGRYLKANGSAPRDGLVLFSLPRPFYGSAFHQVPAEANALTG
jgi:hypothetical protein